MEQTAEKKQNILKYKHKFLKKGSSLSFWIFIYSWLKLAGNQVQTF